MKRPPRLLVVEDENLLRTLVAQFLVAQGFEVIEAADGLDGLSRFADSGPFDLVLMDLNLPRLHGVEACRQIRTQTPGQPILICSATILEPHERDLRALNIRHYLAKPFHPHVLLQVVRALIETGKPQREVA